MRKVTTILCAIAFMISGITMAITSSNKSKSTGYKNAYAATTMQYPYSMGSFDLSEDLVRDLAIRKGVLDTVYITKTDTIKEQVTKVKWRKAAAPEPIVIRDTIREAYYYIATQTGMKEGSDGECIPIYEVHKVDEICPITNNSSVENSNTGE